MFFLAWLQIPTIHFLDSWVNRLIIPFVSWFLRWWILPNHERIGVKKGNPPGISELSGWNLKFFIDYPNGWCGLRSVKFVLPQNKNRLVLWNPQNDRTKDIPVPGKNCRMCKVLRISCIILFRIDGTSNPPNKLHDGNLRATPQCHSPDREMRSYSGFIDHLLVPWSGLIRILCLWMDGIGGFSYPWDSHDKIQHL